MEGQSWNLKVFSEIPVTLFDRIYAGLTFNVSINFDKFFPVRGEEREAQG